MLRALFVASVASNALAARVKVETTSSVAHVMDKIGSLLEARGADAKVLSNLKLFAGQRVTPGATDSLNEILTRVINEIEADVESKIKSGHADTQSEIDHRIGNVKSTTTVVVERKSEADAKDEDWSDCVRAEKAARVAVEEAEAALANSRSNINEPCQLQDDRAPYEWTPNPEKLKFVCDISQSGNCDQQLKNYESQIGNMMAGLRSDVDAKVAAYTEAKQACDAAKADAVEKQDSRDAAVTAWDGKRAECLEKHEPRQVAICMFGAALQAKCEGVEAYRTLMAQIDQVKGGEYSHPDRVAEWKTTSMTKCLLSKVVDGADVNEATLGACEQSVNFDQDVGVLDRKSQLFAELTSPDKFTCAEQTITFTGETWNVPEGDDPASSEYTKEPFHPEVSLAVDSVPFALCRGGNNGGKDQATYIVGEYATVNDDAAKDDCPAGYIVIDTAAECMDAATALSLTWRSSFDLGTTYTPGCSHRINHPRFAGVWFNPTLSGSYDGHSMTGSVAAICKKARATASGSLAQGKWMDRPYNGLFR